jgi:hypothetical protein
MTIVVGLIGAIGLLAVVVLAQVLFFNMQRIEDERKLYAPPPQALLDLQERQLAPISEYRYVDKGAGLVAIPIDRAIPLYVAREKTAGDVPRMDGKRDTNRADSAGPAPQP